MTNYGLAVGADHHRDGRVGNHSDGARIFYVLPVHASVWSQLYPDLYRYPYPHGDAAVTQYLLGIEWTEIDSRHRSAMSDRPYPGEDLASFRARRSRELADEAKGVGKGPTADEQVEAAKAKVRQQNATKAAAPAHKSAVNLNTAEKDADEVERAHDIRRHGGVQPLDKAAIAAADKEISKGTGFGALSAEEQAKVAKGSKSPSRAPAGVAHSTSTPGSTHQTAMAAALASAGVAPNKPEAETKAAPSKAAPVRVAPGVAEKARRAPVTIDPAVAARNNMAAPVNQNDNSVISGRTIEAKGDELQAAKDAAKRGTRGGGGKAAEARAGQRRSAASVAPSVRGGQQFVKMGGNGAEMSSAPGRDWITPSQIKNGVQAPAPAAPKASPAPAKEAAPKTTPTTNPAPVAPAPVKTSGGVEGLFSGTPVLSREGLGMPKPRLGKDITYGATAETGPAANTRRAYNAHIAGGGTDASYWQGRDAKKAAGKAQPKTAAPRTAVVEEAPVSAAPAAPKATVGGGSRKAPSSAAAVGNVNREPMPAENTYSGAVGAIGQRTPMAGPQAAKAASASRPDSAPPARGGGRTGATPRSGEVGGGRVSGGSAGGLHIATEGSDNQYSNIGNVTHVTNVHNYGTISGSSIGSEGSAGRAAGGAGGGGRGAGGERPSGGEGRQQGFNAWYKDSTGKHDLRAGLDHVTGRTGGSGERLDKQKPVVGGGTQKPLASSARSASGGGATSPTNTGTGTTHNWSGPVHQAPVSATGNGTATAPQKTVP